MNLFRFLFRVPVLALVLAWTTACSQDGAGSANPLTSELVENMVAAMGGWESIEAVDYLVQRGSGRRERLGQIPETGAADPSATLSNLLEVIDLRNGRAAFDNEVLVDGGFSQHRTEVLTRLDGQPVAWGTTAGRVRQATSVNGLFSWATQNSPEILLRRNILHVVKAAANVPAGQRAEARMIAGRSFWYGWTTGDGGEIIGLLFDRDTDLLAAYLTLDTDSMLGDQDARYNLGDYRQAGQLLLPFSLDIDKGGRPYASVRYQEISFDDPEALALLEIPEDVMPQARQVLDSGGSWVPLAWQPAGAGVFHVEAFSHNSMVVEFPSFVVVVEAPYTEAQSLTLARMIEARLGKPIRYVAPTHPHYDHTGGVRAMASLGASVLVAAGHEAEMRMIVESPHTNPPDALAQETAERAEVGRVEVFSGMTEVSEGNQRLQLYEVFGIPHVNPMVLAYVPEAGVLFQSDLFFGGPGADATALYQAIRSLGLQVDTIVGGHGGILPFSLLESVVQSN